MVFYPAIAPAHSKLQEPFVALCPLNKLSFCRNLECVQLNRCTLLKMNVVADKLEGKEQL